MVKIRATVAYDGTDFHGFARQRGVRTVQGVLEEKLSNLLRCPVAVEGSGRTDAGVHARAQVVHWEQPAGPPPESYPPILMHRLPPDILVVSAEAVPDSFHARFSAVGKTYRYTIDTAASPDLFTRRFTWHMPLALDLDQVERAAAALVGEHDFTSFCAGRTAAVDKVRTIYEITLARRGQYLDIYCAGSGFLQYMVRIITGTLVDVGLGRMDAAQVAGVLAARDRRQAGRTAPASGLCLWQVDYGAEGALDRSDAVR